MQQQSNGTAFDDQGEAGEAKIGGILNLFISYHMRPFQMTAKQRYLHPGLQAVLMLIASTSVGAFHVPRSRFLQKSASLRGREDILKKDRGCSTTKLRAALLPSIVTKVSPPIRNSLLLGSAAALIYKNRRIFRSETFYPGSSPDPDFAEPIPDGSLGCPVIGNISFYTRKMGNFYIWQASQAGNNKIFKYFAFGKPMVLLSGVENLKKVFNQEFSLIKAQDLPQVTAIFGEGSLIAMSDGKRHQFLRRLIGQSMTPDAVNRAVPALVKSATEQINKLSLEEPVELERVMTSFTLDVAWRQILGLDLQEDEIDTFYDAVNDWIGGVLNPFIALLPQRLKTYTKGRKAYTYLVSKIERKLDDLERNGPDGSTLSCMFFAKDEEDPSKSLTREEILSNSLLLILAGSETAASTLTVAALALGLHKDVWAKLKEEQSAMMSKHEGKEITREMLEKDCPYLDAVVKEVMRIKPLATTGMSRFAQETFVIEGKQIPRGYAVGFNPTLTHSIDPVLEEEDGSHMDIVKGFQPERWLNDKTKPTEYIPFGIGPRYCLGANLALAEIKIFLALFARCVDYDMTNTNADNLQWKRVSIIPKPKDGLVSVSRLSDPSLMPVEALL